MKINNINIEDDSYRVYPIPPIGQSKNDLKKGIIQIFQRKISQNNQNLRMF